MRYHHLFLLRLIAGMGWTARLLGALLLAIVLLIFIGEGGPNPLKLKPVEAIQMTFFLSTCIGWVVGWRWPLIGGAISTGALLLFFAVERAVSGGFPRGLFFYLLLLPGFLFLLNAFLNRAIMRSGSPLREQKP